MFDGYYNAFWFLLVGLAFVWLNLFISSLIRPSDPDPVKLTPYECGEESEGTGFVRFNPRFYVVALVFLIFDIETVFIFPWAVVLKRVSSAPLTAHKKKAMTPRNRART